MAEIALNAMALEMAFNSVFTVSSSSGDSLYILLVDLLIIKSICL